MNVNTQRVSPIKALGATIFRQDSQQLCIQLADAIVSDIEQILERKGQCLVALDHGVPLDNLYRYLVPKLGEIEPTLCEKLAFCVIGEDLESKQGPRFISEFFLGGWNKDDKLKPFQFLFPASSAEVISVFGTKLTTYFAEGGIVDLVISRVDREGQLRTPGFCFDAENAFDKVQYLEIPMSVYSRDPQNEGKALVLNAAAFWHSGKVYLCALGKGTDQEEIVQGMINSGTTANLLYDHPHITVAVSAQGHNGWSTRWDLLDELLHNTVIRYQPGHA